MPLTALSSVPGRVPHTDGAHKCFSEQVTHRPAANLALSFQAVKAKRGKKISYKISVHSNQIFRKSTGSSTHFSTGFSALHEPTVSDGPEDPLFTPDYDTIVRRTQVPFPSVKTLGKAGILPTLFSAASTLNPLLSLPLPLEGPLTPADRGHTALGLAGHVFKCVAQNAGT